MKAVVIGGSGQIGGWLLRSLAGRGHEAVGTYNTVQFPGLVPIDGADLEFAADWLREQKPDAIFFPAGFTWVDGCERDHTKARGANLDQPMNLARVAAQIGSMFIYYSTDYLFDGVDGPYDESAKPNPLNIYGEVKLEAEYELQEMLGDALLIARTSWVFGPERQGKNFAYQLIKALKSGKAMTVPSDQISSPSYGPDVAEASIKLVEMGRSGVYHIVGPEVMSRPEFAQGIAKAFGLDASLIESKTTAELGQGARRPLNGGLLGPKLSRDFPGLMRPLAEALADFRAKLNTDDVWADPLA